VHTRLAPGFVTGCRMEGPDRIVTFAIGLTARELIVDVDAGIAAMRAAHDSHSRPA